MTGLLTCTSWHASLSYNWRHISPWTKVFCLEIYFPLYFSCTFNLLFRNSSFHGFFFFFWKKNLWCERRSDVVWEWLSQFWPSKYSWAGIIISSCTGNHLVFFQKIQKRLSLPFWIWSMNLCELLVCTASKQMDAGFWGGPSAREVIWPKDAATTSIFFRDRHAC